MSGAGDYTRLRAERDFLGDHEPPQGRVGVREWLAVEARNLRRIKLDGLLTKLATARLERENFELLAERSRLEEGW